jgi:hypothetical protein
MYCVYGAACMLPFVFVKWDTNAKSMQKLENGAYIVAFNLESGREY